MMEKGPPNSSEGQQGWFSARNGSGSSVGLESVAQPLALSPWDVVLCVSGTIISCENAVVLLAILHTPALRAPAFLLLGSLATADLLAGLGLLLHGALEYLVPWEAASLLTVGLLVASFTASVSSLLSITIDRYLSLCNALTYHSESTVSRTHVMLLLTWGASACCGLLPAAGWNCLGQPSACSAVRPLTRGQLAALAACLLAALAAVLQLYGAATLAVTLGTPAACWLPFALHGLLGGRSSPALHTYATLLPAAYNSLLNPVIYAFRNREIRKVLWAACCGCSAPPCRARSPSDV
ncbi:G-protein coupled receptor 3 [Passer montanus]|uniref:G-protein coupled receptor 3 n=1 Tax=Passer montanus TaxID=9160 RepID=UPI00195FE95F|nr:G-protein coupled receptor 3 [Passer montanus]